MLRSTSLKANLFLRVAALTACASFTAAGSAQAATSMHISRPVLSSQAIKPAAATLTFTRLDDPADPTFNQLLGIDDAGVISGYYGSGAKGHPNIGYTIAPPYTAFALDNLPSSTQTQATGITPSAITSGFWSPTNLGFSNSGANLDADYGFVRYVSGAGVVTWVSVNNPLVSSTPKVNQVLGVNSSLNAVGFYNDSNGNSHGYEYSVNKGTFSTPFSDSAAVSSVISGINNLNTICGFFTDTKGHTKGFVQPLNSAGVHYLVPGSTFTQFLGVNNANEAVGFYLDGNNIPHGIVYNANSGALTIINDPSGVNGTTINGINNNHQAVGFYVDGANNTHGVVINNVP